VAPRLGILAGSGTLPQRVLDACRSSGRDAYVVAFKGETHDETVATAPHAWVRIGAVGRTIKLLREAGCEDVVFAGPVRRPALASLVPDRRGATLLAKLAAASGGDDSLFSILVSELEGEGFHVIGADDVIADILAPPGPLGAHTPDRDAMSDIERGVGAVRALGAHDIGQAAVVQQGRVLGVEAAEGTDALIARCAGLRLEGPGGVLVKLKKPRQQRRVDLPAIGRATVDASAAAGLRGIAVEAGGTLVFDRDDAAAAADLAGLFVIGLTLDEPNEDRGA
jgi:DUF1009 family protein